MARSMKPSDRGQLRFLRPAALGSPGSSLEMHILGYLAYVLVSEGENENMGASFNCLAGDSDAY